MSRKKLKAVIFFLCREQALSRTKSRPQLGGILKDKIQFNGCLFSNSRTHTVEKIREKMKNKNLSFKFKTVTIETVKKLMKKMAKKKSKEKDLDE